MKKNNSIFSFGRPGDSQRRPRIGVLLGGRSSERRISLKSGGAVFRALKRLRLSAVCVDPGKRNYAPKSLKNFDVAFIALHGRGGEDGTIQKTLERLRVPYVGSDSKACRKAFDKVRAKRLFRCAGIPTPDFLTVTRGDWRKRLSNFPAPFFLKPFEEGSSLGIIFVRDLKRAAGSVERAFKAYKHLYAEERVVGREFTVGILEEKALPVIELKPRRLFYDYYSKYTRGMTRYLVPAPVSSWRTRELQRIALQAHRCLGLRDFSRVDIILDQKGTPQVLEVNAIPGFTELSLLPKAARSEGISFDELCLRLVNLAGRRHARCKRGKIR